jgi:hypothetical protein
MIFDRAVDEMDGRHPHVEWLESHCQWNETLHFRPLHVRRSIQPGE